MGIFSFFGSGKTGKRERLSGTNRGRDTGPDTGRGKDHDTGLAIDLGVDQDYSADREALLEVRGHGQAAPDLACADGDADNIGDPGDPSSLTSLTSMDEACGIAPDASGELFMPRVGPGMRIGPSHLLRMRMVDGVCHLSEELRGNLAVDDALARLARELGLLAVPVAWHRPAAFEKLFGDGRRGETSSETSSGKATEKASETSSDASSRERSRDAGKNGTPARARAVPSPAATALAATTWVDAYVRRLFEKAMAKRASDIHITYMGPWTQVSFRRMGLVLEEESLDGPTGLQLVRGIFQGQLSQAESGFSEYERYDGRIADRSFLPAGLFAVRLHTEPIQSPHLQGPGTTLAMRLLFDAASASGTLVERLDCLGFEKEQRELVESFSETTGMTVVSGPTGHGKTTVLKNILEALAENVPTRNYYSLEDPPEYTILGVRQLNVFTRAVSDEERERSLLEALAGLMRSDPDVILLGEIRHPGTAKAAVNAALTGHAVWTTVHASSGLNVLARFREMGLSVDSVLGVLTGVTYQRLLPTLCPRCREPLLPKLSSLNPKLATRLKELFPDSLEALHVRGQGCSFCDHLGLSGQKVACEVISLRDRRLRELLSRGRMEEAAAHWIREMNGMTHVAHARLRVARGEVDPRLAEERLGVPLDSDLQDQAWALKRGSARRQGNVGQVPENRSQVSGSEVPGAEVAP